MRTKFRWSAGLTIALSGAMGFLGSAPLLKAAQLKEAQVTQIVKDVQLLSAQATPRPAAVRDNVREGTAVRTGVESRTELTFTDQTLARLGANTLFNFQGGTRNLDLGGGAILLSVPKDAHSATVRTAAVTAAVSGGTAALEHHGNAYCKFICLEGRVRVSLKGTRQSVLLRPGQMLVTPPNPSRLTEPVEIDLERFVNTCVLITDFPPLANQPLIAEAIAQQQHEKAEGNLIESNQVVLSDGGDLVTLVDPTMLDTIDQKTNAIGGLGIGFQPIKFGPLPTIIAPVPYVINAGTLIQTDPFIQTNGATDFGRIYRGNAADGTPADYFFGSASAFDVTTNFNTLSEVPANLPIAAFKFTSLQLSGNPTISLGTGGATNLVLISEGAITSGAAGGTLTFPNLSLVLLATQNGSITLGNTISFANMPDLRFYARGAGSNLTLASPMTNMGSVNLTAEGSVQVNADEGVQFFNSFAGVDFLAGTGLISAGSSINIAALGTVNFSMAQFSIGAGASVFLGSNITGTVSINAGANQTLFANASTVQVLAANISVTGGTTMTFGNSTDASFTTLTGSLSAPTESFFHPGGLLGMSSAGDLNAQSILGGNLISASSNINVTGDLGARAVSSSQGTITVGGNLTATQIVQALGAAGTINVTGTLTSPDVEAVGNVTADHVVVLNLNLLNPASNSTLTAGAGGITPFGTSGTPAQHTFNVFTIQSHTAALGLNFSGNNYLLPGASGGFLTINADHQTFSAADGINGANFNGKDSNNAALEAGGGGTFVVNATANLDLLGTNITATSGIMGDPNGNQNTLGGNGGNVTLTSGGAMTMQGSVIQVSSADSPGVANRRSSKRGGNITMSSSAPTGTAIAINNSSQLLALLEATTTGPGGLIAVSASGANSGIVMNGRATANHGAIDIRHTGAAGTVSLGAPATLVADIIKVAALGDNGVLTIGLNTTLSANTVLKLYATGSNGQIIFAGNCTIGGGNLNIIAAPTVTVSPGVDVTVTGAQAQIFTNQGNYSAGNGGNGAGGTFIGAGATTVPGGFGGQPALGPPGGP